LFDCIEMADAAGLMEAAGARFSSLELIGRGSFGDVYKAYVFISCLCSAAITLLFSCL
jgi:hypothetical protein